VKKLNWSLTFVLNKNSGLKIKKTSEIEK